MIKWINWINENEGFLMVMITCAYVVATILICVFNGISAKASRDQIAASQKQQEQNTGLQLYSVRSEIINKIWKHKFEEVFWDVHMLFNQKISDEFDALFREEQKLNKPRIEIQYFEEELNIILPQRAKHYVFTQIDEAKELKNYDELEKTLKEALENAGSNNMTLESINVYIDSLKMIDSKQKSVDDKTLHLILELRKFTMDSAQFT